MRYECVTTAVFVERPNRFVAKVVLDGEETSVHVKNTGRCRELLVPGSTVVLSRSENPSRKYRYDLISVYKGELLVNMDSQAPNRIFQEWIASSERFGSDPKVFPEHTHGNSRFDFYIEDGDRMIFVEVKGVTLENDRVCMFPDAPTERGSKHLRGLMECIAEGYEAYVAFVIQMEGMKSFAPNYATDPVFAEELARAKGSGVEVLLLGCSVGIDTIEISYELEYHS